MASRIRQWLNKARYLEGAARRLRDRDMLTAVHRFMSIMIQVEELRRRFEESPGRQIEGWNGVAEQFGISPGAVELWIKRRGLTVADFQDVTADLESLLAKSRPFQAAHGELNECLRRAATEENSRQD